VCCRGGLERILIWGCAIELFSRSLGRFQSATPQSIPANTGRSEKPARSENRDEVLSKRPCGRPPSRTIELNVPAIEAIVAERPIPIVVWKTSAWALLKYRRNLFKH